jgi:hypothetical protein
VEVVVLTQVVVIQQLVVLVVLVAEVETTAGHIQQVLVLPDKDLLVVMVLMFIPMLTVVEVEVEAHQK